MADTRPTPPNPLPSITALGIALAETEHASRRLDERTAGRCMSPREDQADRMLDDRIEALQQAIATMPAATLADVAVQLGTAATFACILSSSEWSHPLELARLAELHRAMNRITLSVLPVVAAAAGLDMAAMAWDDVDARRAGLFFGAEASA